MKLLSEKQYKLITELAYQGNIGIMELTKFYGKATPEQKKQLKDHISAQRHEDAWKLVQSVTGVKLHKMP